MAEIPAYTLEELDQLNLPGYGIPATLPEIAHPDTDWWPGLSLSIYRRNPQNAQKLQALTGVRRNSTTHNGVVSTITSQFAQELQLPMIEESQSYVARPSGSKYTYELDMLEKDAPLTTERSTLAHYRHNPEPLPFVWRNYGNSTYPGSNESPRASTLITVAGDALERKLSFPSVLAYARTNYRSWGMISLSQVMFGFSYVGDHPESSQPLFEPLVMYGAAVLLNKSGVELVPPENKKYESLGWTDDSRTFAQDVLRKDAFNLSPASGDRAVLLCAYGMCLVTTASVSIAMNGGQGPAWSA